MSSIQLDPAYDPKTTEPAQLKLWEKIQAFKADPTSSKPPFCIIIPPPNVTGALHMGHALVNTLQDVLIRFKRMNGFEALWVPGTDHAGIATQTLVEKNLIAKYGKRRNEWTRGEFLHHVWEWKKHSEEKILSQLKALGASCDFSTLAFTLDETRSNAVKVTFKKLFDEGLIYRGNYLVNWDPLTQTALADDEVEYEEQAGFMYTLRYPLKDSSEWIEIATTRPETLLGDTAVAVNPSDPRYAHLVGKKIALPLTSRVIPIVADGMVDKDFGTGAVKITPAHDPNDYQVALRLELPMINLLNPNGTLNAHAGIYEGMRPEEARGAVVKALENLGLFVKKEKHIHRVGISYRSKAVIEPYLSKQWFVKMDPFKTLLRKLVDEGNIKLVPEAYKNTYDHWINNLRDWCISRQLWWGHQIPIWYHKEDPTIILCEGIQGPPQQVKDHPQAYHQDQDVLDTWFSSALWPFSSLGWPDHDIYLKKFYPNSTLVTGHDILFFWVARMMAFGTHIMKQAPFPEVFLHGLIFGKSYFKTDKGGGITYIMGEEKEKYDEGAPLPKDIKFRWEKMSKSKGNVLDPLCIMDEYGTDAVRMALVTCPSQNRQIDLDKRRFEEFKNFANKLWNGARFIFMHIEDFHTEELCLSSIPYSLEDEWILTKLSYALNELVKALDNYHFDKAASVITDFFWNDFCAHYLEIAKPVLNHKKGIKEERKLKQKVLLCIFNQVLRALHPFTPFITESLFQKLKETFSHKHTSQDPLANDFLTSMKSACLAVAPFPKPLFENPEVIPVFESLLTLLHHIREMRGELQIPPGDPITVYLEKQSPIHKQHAHLLEALTKIEKIHFCKPPLELIVSTKMAADTLISVVLPAHLVAKEIARLEKDLIKLEQELENSENKLRLQDFIDKAPSAVVDKMREGLKSHYLAKEVLLIKLNEYKSK